MVEKCILQDFASKFASELNVHPYHERNRLLSILLSDRSVARVVCAPAAYGKSVLAYQYASVAFEPENVVWVQADLPVFLLSLDSGTIDKLFQMNDETDQGNAQQRLFVFDNCPPLSVARTVALTMFIKKLIAHGQEVVVTTQDTSWLETDRLAINAITAFDLFLTEQELERWQRETSFFDEISTQAESEGAPSLFCIPGCRGSLKDARKTYLNMLMSMDVRTEAEALSVIAVVLSGGSIHELQVFASEIIAAHVKTLEQWYPHCGVRVLDPMFNAVRLSDEDKFLLVGHHLSAMRTSLKKFETDLQLVECLIEHLLKHGQSLLATRFACAMLEEERRQQFFDNEAETFFLIGQPLTLLELANTLDGNFLLGRNRWVKTACALGSLGEIDLACQTLVSSQLNLQQPTFSENAFKGMRQVSFQFAAPEPSAHFCSSKLFSQLFALLFAGEVETDAETMKHLIDCELAREGEHTADRSGHPSFKTDFLKLLDESLESPQRGAGALERIASTGYSLVDSLTATCLFCRALLHFWPDRFLDLSDPMKRSPLSTRSIAAEDADVLVRLEKLAARLFAREVVALPPNVYEVFLFAQLKQLIGERVFRLVSDKILSRINDIKTGLARQHRRWADMNNKGLEKRKAMAKKKLDPQPKEKKALRINTLGRFEIEALDPEIVVKDKVRKQLRLLISLLAINDGREVSRPWVQQVMWPGSSEYNARQNLYSMWSQLNRSIHDKNGNCPYFESFPLSLCLNTRLVETDVSMLTDVCDRLRRGGLTVGEYERSIDKLEDIYRGPLLPGEDAIEVVARRKMYQDKMLEALLKAGDSLRKRGETNLALRYFQFAFHTEPAREDICHALMTTLWKLNRHGEALSEYFVCKHAQIDRFGVEGSSRLRQLYDAILHDVS